MRERYAPDVAFTSRRVPGAVCSRAFGPRHSRRTPRPRRSTTSHLERVPPAREEIDLRLAARAARIAPLLLALVTRDVVAQGTLDPVPADSSSAPSPPSVRHSRNWWLSSAFITGTAGMLPLDRKLQSIVHAEDLQSSHALRSTVGAFNWLGGTGVLALGAGAMILGRVSGHEGMAAVGLRSTEAIVVSGAIVAAVKTVAGRQRPYLSPDDADEFSIGRGLHGGRTSFPSGHTAAAFSAATVLALESAERWPGARWVVTPLLYGGATMVGFSRMYDSKHWASDVMLGAGVGTVTGLRVMRWNRAHPHNRLARWLAGASIVPMGDGIAVTLGH